MSYLSSEQSVASGQPVELYDFADDLGVHSRITSAGYEITYNSYTYVPEPCRRTELRISDNHKKNDMAVTLSRDNAWAARFVAGPIEGRATLQIYRGHGADFVNWWYGVIKQVKFDKDGVPTVYTTPRTSSVSRVGRRRVCQKLCDHALYGAECKLNEDTYKHSGTVQSVSGLVVTSTTFGGQADGYFKAGKIVVNAAQRMITAHTGNNVTLSRTIPGVVAGMSFNAYAGCDRLPATCLSKGNKANFGGEQFLPTKNLFTGAALV